MRSTLGAVALLLLAAPAFGQHRTGAYRTPSGSAVPWEINEHDTLIWAGKPYLPVGVRVDPTATAIRDAKAAGIGDVLVDLPASGAGWADAFAILDAAGDRYVVRIDSLAPAAPGVAVEPQGYRMVGTLGGKPVDIPLPGALSALIVLATKRDAQIVESAFVPVVDGHLRYTLRKGPALEQVLLIYPQMRSLEQPDYWEGMDTHRDALLASLKRFHPGPGLRGIVNPIGRTLSLPATDLRFVPTSDGFKTEFAALLEDRYRNVDTAQKAWSMSGSPFSTSDVVDGHKVAATPAKFLDLARLIPLWAGTRGLADLWDPATNKLYACDKGHSTIWKDIADTVNKAAARRYTRLVSAIHSVTDVPVIQEWVGWATPYETQSPVVDGIGMKAAGTKPSEIADTASRAASSLLRWPSPGWLAATDIDLGSSPDSIAQLPSVLDDLTSMGARGMFVRADSPELLKAVGAESTKRAGDSTPSSYSTLPVFFPENAMNPAAPQRLAGGRWWLPSPVDGNRIDLGSNYFAYRMSGSGSSTFVIWARQPKRALLRVANPRAITFKSFDGSDPAAKIIKNGIEVQVGETPMVLSGTEEIPIPQDCIDAEMATFARLIALASAEHRDLTEERIQFSDALTGVDRNPGGSFVTMRHAVDAAAQKVGKFVWLECERSIDNNFSEVVALPGCSGEGALFVRPELVPDGGFFANLEVPTRTKEDQEVWIAARIPREHRDDVTVVVAGQTMSIAGDPISPYGHGFAWYKLGVTRLGGGSTKLKVLVEPKGDADIAIDVLLFTPEHFKPDGIRMPSISTK